MSVKRCTIAIIYIWRPLALLLLLFSTSIADGDSPPKKNILSKIFGRFRGKSSAGQVEPGKVERVVAADSGDQEMLDEDNVCTSSEQACSSDVQENSESVAVDEGDEVSEDTSREKDEEAIENTPSEGESNEEDQTEIKIESSEEETATKEKLNTDASINAPNDDPSPFEIEIPCKDLHENCPTWSTQTDPTTNLTPCTTASAYMSHYCPQSCGTCILVDIDRRLRELSTHEDKRIHPLCSDDNFDCVTWARAGECEKNPKYMYEVCRSSCGVCSEKSNYFGSGQRTQNGKKQDLALTEQRIDETTKYMQMVNSNHDYKKVRSKCLNQDKDCAFWWAVGECTINEAFMNMYCAPTCQTCHLIEGFGS